MRVTTTGGMVVTLEDPSVANDSIAGATEFGPARMSTLDLRLLEVQRFDSMKTFGFVGLNLAIIVAVSCFFAKVQPHYASC
jgi:hypothetical protein